MLCRKCLPLFQLPKNWTPRVKSALLHVISLAHYAITYSRSWAANSINERVRLKAEVSRLTEEAALLREELRIHKTRISQIHPQRRPFYPPRERMAILELKAARGWSLSQTAERFLVTAETISSWMKRVDEQGPDALVQLPRPVNRFPDFVRYVVQRLKILCPTLGKNKIAETLAWADLHLAATTVGRLLKENPPPDHGEEPERTPDKPREVTAKYPNHVHHVDLTVVPTLSGFWTAWLPFSLPQRWPFCFWVAVVMDHFSRRIMGITSFLKQPNSVEVRAFLGRTIQKTKVKPKHLICDKGVQFHCDGFRAWCRRKGIKPRFGAVGRHGSIALVERLILTIKCLLGCLLLIPFRREQFQKELSAIVDWYNQHRPHTALGGRTPNEVYYNQFPSNRKPRFEPRAAWPRASPCSSPITLVKGKSGVRLELQVDFLQGKKHLPVVTLRRAA
jgi:transposase InsO family protein